LGKNLIKFCSRWETLFSKKKLKLYSQKEKLFPNRKLWELEKGQKTQDRSHCLVYGLVQFRKIRIWSQARKPRKLNKRAEDHFLFVGDSRWPERPTSREPQISNWAQEKGNCWKNYHEIEQKNICVKFFFNFFVILHCWKVFPSMFPRISIDRITSLEFIVFVGAIRRVLWPKAVHREKIHRKVCRNFSLKISRRI